MDLCGVHKTWFSVESSGVVWSSQDLVHCGVEWSFVEFTEVSFTLEYGGVVWSSQDLVNCAV